MIERLNRIGSQVWAFLLIGIGVGTLWLAAVCHASDVRAAILSTGGGLATAGLAIFQHPSEDAGEKQ